jgi:hypothetical protein
MAAMKNTMDPATTDVEPKLDFDPDALRAKDREERDRRLRPDANAQYVEMARDFRHYIDDPYVDPGFTRAPLTDSVDVVIVGGWLRRPAGRGVAARSRDQGHPHHREGRRLRRHLVLEPLSGRPVRYRVLHLSTAAGGDLGLS